MARNEKIYITRGPKVKDVECCRATSRVTSSFEKMGMYVYIQRHARTHTHTRLKTGRNIEQSKGSPHKIFHVLKKWPSLAPASDDIKSRARWEKIMGGNKRARYTVTFKSRRL